MKLMLITALLCFTSLANASLDNALAKKLIETRQAKMGRPVVADVLTVEAMAEYKGATLYRVNAKILNGEQTYQIRFPLESKDAVTDVVLNTSIYSQDDIAKDVKVTESELAVMVQMAVDGGADYVAKEFPDMIRTGIYIFANGERFKSPAAVILTFQIAYKKMQVPLLRKVYVTRDLKAVEVGYGD